MRRFAFWAPFTAATLLVVSQLNSCSTREEQRFALVDSNTLVENTLDDCTVAVNMSMHAAAGDGDYSAT